MSQGPPCRITPEMLSRVVQIGEAIGRAEAAGVSQDLHLRRINRIRTIQGSLAIEGNILNEEQISTILDGKPVVAPLRDIQEARNAIKAYDRYEQWNAASEADLLTAHEVLMAGLVDAPGRYRRAGVAVMGQGRVHHVGPPAERVPQLMADLLAWLGIRSRARSTPARARTTVPFGRVPPAARARRSLPLCWRPSSMHFGHPS